MTLGTLLKQGREILQNAGIAEWDLDAWYLLEYVTGVLMEAVFHANWWDYSNKKFNFQSGKCRRNRKPRTVR